MINRIRKFLKEQARRECDRRLQELRFAQLKLNANVKSK